MQSYLKHCEQALPKCVKILTLFLLGRVKIELSSENLGAQKGKDNDE